MSPQRPLSAIVESTAQFLAETAPAAALSPMTLESSIAVARHELPLTHSLRLIPRPFSTLARRSYRLGLDVPRGYAVSLAAWPYYHQRRREPAVWCAALTRAHVRRCERARARRAALTVTRLPPMMYGQGKVA